MAIPRVLRVLLVALVIALAVLGLALYYALHNPVTMVFVVPVIALVALFVRQERRIPAAEAVEVEDFASRPEINMDNFHELRRISRPVLHGPLPDVQTVLRRLHDDQIVWRSPDWEPWWGVLPTSAYGDLLALSLKRKNGKVQMEDLRCTVIEPDGTAVHAADLAPGSEDKRTAERIVGYPADFGTSHRDWPLRPGRYEVRWLTRRITTRGTVSLAPLATVVLWVSPDGRVSETDNS